MLGGGSSAHSSSPMPKLGVPLTLTLRRKACVTVPWCCCARLAGVAAAGGALLAAMPHGEGGCRKSVCQPLLWPYQRAPAALSRGAAARR